MRGNGLLPPVVVRGPVGVFVEEDVGERPSPEVQAAGSPRFVEDSPTFVVVDLERADVAGRHVAEPAPPDPATSEELWELLLRSVLFSSRQAALAHRQRHRRRALEDGQVGGHLRDLLHDLHTGGARPEHADPPTGQIEPALRPSSRVVALAVEVGQPGQLRHVRLGGEPDGEDHVAAVDRAAVVEHRRPGRGHRIEVGGDHPPTQLHVRAEIEHVDGVVEVAAQLVTPGEPLIPIPVAPDALERELVVGPVRVDARAGVGVPVPYAAVSGTGVHDAYAEPLAAQPPQCVQAAEPGAHDDDVDVEMTVTTAHGSSSHVAARAAVDVLASSPTIQSRSLVPSAVAHSMASGLMWSASTCCIRTHSESTVPGRSAPKMNPRSRSHATAPWQSGWVRGTST